MGESAVFIEFYKSRKSLVAPLRLFIKTQKHTIMKKYMFQSLQYSIVALFLLVGGVLFAQPGGGGRDMNPEQRAKQQTAQMTEQLSLSEAQAGKVQEINLKYAKQAQAARENADGDWESMRGKMTAMRQEQDKELQTIVTQEQWQKWTAFREEQRANRGNWGDGNRPKTDPPAETGKKDKKGKKAKKSTPDSDDKQ